MTRFKAGDVVVLNGHRLEVSGESEGWVWLRSMSGEPVCWVPGYLMPDPELREDPVSVMQHDTRDLLEALGLSVHARPYSPHEVVQHEILPAIRQLRVELGEGVYRDEWDTFGTKRGVVMAEPETPALTPGMTVAHRDGRLGVFLVQGDIDGSLGWHPFGEATSVCSPPGYLRPVTLVEKPERDAARAAVTAALDANGFSGLMSTVADIAYDAMFGELPVEVLNPSEPLAEWQCPDCGATTWARMADHP